MYQVGDLVIYGSEGVCRVKEIGVPDIPDINRERLYYFLEPLYRDGVIYTPTTTVVFMRPAVTRAEAEALIAQIPSIKEQQCDEKNLRLLTEQYDRYLDSHSCEDLICLIKSVARKKQVAISQSKKPGAVDERYMKRAEELLYGELAAALSVSKDEMIASIRGQVDPPANAG